MKKMLMFAALFCSVVALAQEPVITFNETTHDLAKSMRQMVKLLPYSNSSTKV